MAQTVHLKLMINGNDIMGESTIESMDRAETIECNSFEWGVEAPHEKSTGRRTGHRQHKQVVITKRIDKSTPLLFKALTANETVDSAEFMFFRPSPVGDGSEEKFMTTLIERGRISNIKQESKDNIMSEGKNSPPMWEEVSFVFERITITYEEGGITHTDTWGERT